MAKPYNASITLPEELHIMAKEKAMTYNLPFSKYVRKLIENDLKNKK